MTDIAKPPSLFAPLRTPVFGPFYASILLTMLGIWMVNVGCGWSLSVMNHAGYKLGLLQTCLLAPGVLLSLPAGVLADKLSRRHIALFAAVGMVLACADLTLMAVLHRLDAWVLLLHALAIGTATALMGPVLQAIIQDMVGRELLPQAVTLYSIALNGGRATGPALAGIVISGLGVAWTFGGNAVAYGVLALLLLRWRPPPQRVATEETFRGAFIGGLRFVKSDRAFAALLVRLMLFLVCASGLLAVMPLVARDRVGGGAQIFGYLSTCLGAGALVGAFGRGWLSKGRPWIVQPGACAVVIGLSYFGLATFHGLVPSAIMILFYGAAWTNAAISFQSMAQLQLPESVRGRGISVYLMVFSLGTLLGGLAWGSALEVVPVRVGLALAGAGTIILDQIARRLAKTPVNSRTVDAVAEGEA